MMEGFLLYINEDIGSNGEVNVMSTIYNHKEIKISGVDGGIRIQSIKQQKVKRSTIV